MKIFNKLKSMLGVKNASMISAASFGDWFTEQHLNGEDAGEITYFTCLKTLSEAIGKMPMYLFDADKNRVKNHETARIFSVSVNAVQTPLQFFTLMEYNRNHYGNAYAYINRDRRGKLVSLVPLDPQSVQVWVNNTDEFSNVLYSYKYTDNRTGKSYWISPDDMIHVKSWMTSKDGLVGKAVREILADSMQGNKAAMRFLNNLYRSGLTANCVVKYVGDLSREKQAILLQNIIEQSKSNGRLIALPVGCEVQPLDMKLTDSQFAELMKYNSLRIAAAFGIQPTQLNDYSKASYANSSAQNLSFYVDTLLYNVSVYEQEFNRKLLTTKEQDAGMRFKFNVSVILRGDPTQQADVIQKLVQTGVYSVNDALSLLDKPPTPNGEVHMVNGSYVRLEDIGAAYRANQGGDSG